jgi:hypothetical protein
MSATASIAARIEALEADERAIVEKLLDRIEQGRRVYGPWRVDDGRDYPAEALDEVIDALHYCAASLLRRTSSCRCGGACRRGPVMTDAILSKKDSTT